MRSFFGRARRSDRDCLRAAKARGVVAREALEGERAQEPGRHARRHQAGLDHERARAREGIEQGAARLPARERDDPRGQRLGQRRAALGPAPAALVQGVAGGVDRERGAVAEEVDVQAEVGGLALDARPAARAGQELVDHGVLGALRDEERVRQGGVAHLGVDPQGPLRSDERGPVDGRDAGVERVAIRRREAGEPPEDAHGRAQLEVRAPGVRERALEAHAAHLALDAREAQGAHLLVQHGLETLRAGDEEDVTSGRAHGGPSSGRRLENRADPSRRVPPGAAGVYEGGNARRRRCASG